MAERAKLGLGALTASKEAAAVVAAVQDAPAVEAPARRGRGRPKKVTFSADGVAVAASNGPTFSQTIRMTPGLRKALRRAAELETDKAGKIVSAHDVILKAVHAYLRRNDIAIEE